MRVTAASAQGRAEGWLLGDGTHGSAISALHGRAPARRGWAGKRPQVRALRRAGGCLRRYVLARVRVHDP